MLESLLRADCRTLELADICLDEVVVVEIDEDISTDLDDDSMLFVVVFSVFVLR